MAEFHAAAAEAVARVLEAPLMWIAPAVLRAVPARAPGAQPHPPSPIACRRPVPGLDHDREEESA